MINAFLFAVGLVPTPLYNYSVLNFVEWLAEIRGLGHSTPIGDCFKVFQLPAYQGIGSTPQPSKAGPNIKNYQAHRAFHGEYRPLTLAIIPQPDRIDRFKTTSYSDAVK